jgi:antitoxin HicB
MVESSRSKEANAPLVRRSRNHQREVSQMKYRVLVEQDEDGVFVAEVPALPGCISQGFTRDEAIENIKEAIAGYLESLKAHNEPVPPPITEEVVEVAM